MKQNREKKKIQEEKEGANSEEYKDSSSKKDIEDGSSKKDSRCKTGSGSKDLCGSKTIKENRESRRTKENTTFIVQKKEINARK